MSDDKTALREVYVALRRCRTRLVMQVERIGSSRLRIATSRVRVQRAALLMRDLHIRRPVSSAGGRRATGSSVSSAPRLEERLEREGDLGR